MPTIISTTSSTVKSHSSVSHLQLNYQKLPPLTKGQFKKLKSEHHKIIEQIIKDNKYKSGIANTLRSLANNSNKDGTTLCCYQTIAYERNCCHMTIVNHAAKLEADGVISKRKRGWQQTNAITILAIQHWNMNKNQKTYDNLTSLSSSLRREEEEKRELHEKERVMPLADARQTLPRQKPGLETDANMDFELELSQRDREKGTETIAFLKSMLNNIKSNGESHEQLH